MSIRDQDRDPYTISKISAKYQLCAIHTADNTDGKVTGGGKKFTAGRNLSRPRYSGERPYGRYKRISESFT